MPHRLRFSSILALTLSAACAARGLAAEQVELHLANGQTVTGELENEDGESVTVKSSMPTKNGKAMSISKQYPRGDISSIVKLQDPEEAYKARDAAAKTADERTALALWCRDQAMADRAVEQAKRALALDAKQDAAAKLLGELGYVQVDGAWVKESEWLAKEGKVRYQGKIMTIAEADALKAQDKKNADLKAAQQNVDDKTAALAALDKRIADLPKRPAEIDKELAKDQADLATAQSAGDKITSAKAALDAAQKSLTDAQNQSRQQTGTGPNRQPATNAPQQNLAPLQQAVEDAQKAYNAAKRDGGSADVQVAQLKGKIAALNDEKAHLAKKGDELRAERETLAKQLDQAKAALEEAKKAAATAPTPAPAAP